MDKLKKTREDLIRIGLSYYDALTSEDGTREPFSPKCGRRENGMTTAGGTPRFEPGTVIVMDRGYIDYNWFVQLTHQGVYFVTRLKGNASFEVVENLRVPAASNILKDQIIFFYNQAVPDREHFFRIVEIWDEERQRSFTFLTNNMKFAASTIAATYKDRWQVELFFKAIKQNLKIKTFLGTNPNAV